MQRLGDIEKAPIESSALVGVFAVAQFGTAAELHAKVFGKQAARLCALAGQVVGDRRVVGGRALEGLEGQLAARRFAEATVTAQFVEQRSVIRGIDGNRHVGVVLGRGANHRRAADVDLLDRLCEGDVGIRNGGLERVEVDGDQIDRPDLLLLEISLVSLVIPTGENPAVDSRVERLDPPAEHFGATRELCDVDHREARFSQRSRGAPPKRPALRRVPRVRDQNRSGQPCQKQTAVRAERRATMWGALGNSPLQKSTVGSARRLPEVDRSRDPASRQASNCRWTRRPTRTSNS